MITADRFRARRDQMAADLASADYATAVLWGARNLGSLPAILDNLRQTPDGQPADRLAACDAFLEWGQLVLEYGMVLAEKAGVPRPDAA